MPKPTDYDKTHLRNLTAICTRIDRIFQKAAEEAAKIGVTIKNPLPEDKIFSFDDYPATQKQIERLLNALQESMQTTIVNGVRSAWTLSNNKNNALVSRIFGDRVGDLSKEQYRRYFSTNGAALDAFLGRKEQGMNLSDRVWRYTNAFKHEIELGLDLGIRTGESAAKMTRSLRQYLQHPDKLFRRVRDKHGNLRLSKAAQAFHPGRGVYRSSYKNARRLAATETNMAYRTSDHLRWQQMDFVVGIEIKLSNNHTLNGMPLTDICDELKGKYPKDFKFVGWHPHCRCHAVTILKTEEEMQQDTQRILSGEKPKKGSVNTVRDVPAAFNDWVDEHSERIKMGGNLPYFVKDNRNVVDRIIGIATEPQKTPLEIAKERHEARIPEDIIDIQQRWNETRLRKLAASIDDGYLPKEVKERLEEMLVNNNQKHFDEINAKIAFLQKRAKTHMERSQKDIADIKQRWEEKQLRDNTIRTRAENILAEAKKWSEVDYSVLEKFVTTGNLTKMRDESMNVIKAIRAMRDEEKALADLIPDVHGWHNTFSLSELREAHGKIQSTLDYWKAKGYDLATDSKLHTLMKELEQKIKFVENPGAFKAGLKAHKTWQVQQDAYCELLDKVETRINVIQLTDDYNTLQEFKTSSKYFKDYMAKAKAALDDGDAMSASHWLHEAETKMNELEAKRKAKTPALGVGKPGGVKFDRSEFTDKKKEDALWFGGKLSKRDKQVGWNEADKYMTPLAQQNWLSWNPNQREVGYLYTSGSRYINEPLFATYKGKKIGLNGKARNSWADINTLTDMIDNAVPLPQGMWVQHGEDMGAFSARFGIDLNSASAKARKDLVGKSAVNKPFTSCGCSKYSGFDDSEVVINIYCPAGTKGIYAEPFSHYGDGGYGPSGFNWEGQSRQAEGYSSSYENEIILQRGSVFRITKIEFNRSEGKWYVDCDLIEQPKKTDNVI